MSKKKEKVDKFGQKVIIKNKGKNKIQKTEKIIKYLRK